MDKSKKANRKQRLIKMVTEKYIQLLKSQGRIDKLQELGIETEGQPDKLSFDTDKYNIPIENKDVGQENNVRQDNKAPSRMSYKDKEDKLIYKTTIRLSDKDISMLNKIKKAPESTSDTIRRLIHQV